MATAGLFKFLEVGYIAILSRLQLGIRGFILNSQFVVDTRVSLILDVSQWRNGPEISVAFNTLTFAQQPVLDAILNGRERSRM